MRISNNFWILLLLPTFLWSCIATDTANVLGPQGDDSQLFEEDYGVDIYDDVVIVDEDPCVVGVDVPEDREVLTFSFACQPQGRGFEPGNVVIGTAGGGYLRRILSVAVDGYELTTWTEEASLSDVIEAGSFDEEIALGGERASIDFGNTSIYHGAVGPAELEIHLDRAAFEIDPALVMNGHWEDGEVQNFTMDLGVDLGADLLVTVNSTEGLRIGQDVPLWTQPYPFAFAIGPIPVVGVLTAELSVGVRVDANGKVQMQTGASGSLELHNRKKYTASGGWVDDDINEGNWDVTLPNIEIDRGLKVSAYAQLETSMKLYGVAGPSFRQKLALNVAGDIHCEGIEYEVGATLSSKGSIKFTIFNKFNLEQIFLKVKFTMDFFEGILPWPFDSPVSCEQIPIACGETVQGDTRDGSSTALDGYSCNVGNYQAPEIVYEWKATQDGPVTWELVDPDPTATNHDLFVIDGMWNLVAGDCLDWGLNDLEFEAEKGQTYYLVVDGHNQDAGTYTATLSCDEAASDPGDIEDTINPF